MGNVEWSTLALPGVQERVALLCPIAVCPSKLASFIKLRCLCRQSAGFIVAVFSIFHRIDVQNKNRQYFVQALLAKIHVDARFRDRAFTLMTSSPMRWMPSSLLLEFFRLRSDESVTSLAVGLGGRDVGAGVA